MNHCKASGVDFKGKHHTGLIVERGDLAAGFVALELEIEGFGPAGPGQFVVVQSFSQDDRSAGASWPDGPNWPQATGAELRAKVALLRRPFSIADLSGTTKSCRLRIQFRVLGPGTAWLARNAQKGTRLKLLGPLGKGFVTQGTRQAILVAGGMGVAPMMFLARQLREQDSQVVLLAGAKSLDELSLKLIEGAVVDEKGDPTRCCKGYDELGVTVGISTDDGSLGRLGFVSDMLADSMSRHRELAESGTVIYTCGPEAMMAKVVQTAGNLHLPVQVCMERYMACGLGACQSCVCRQKSAQAQDGWAYKLVCTDGPVFDGQGILWPKNTMSI